MLGVKTCEACGYDVAPLVYLGSGGMRSKCPRTDCSAEFGAVHDVAETEPQAPQVAPSTPTPRAKASAPKAIGPAPDVVALARQRLRELDAEIKRIRGLQRERDQLSKMIGALAPKRTRGRVVQLRRAES